MTYQIKPLGNRILAERIEETTQNGIIIPDSAQEKPVKAIVITVGEGNRNADGNLIPMDVKIGDILLFTKWAGGSFKLNGKDFIILKEDEAIAILNHSI